MCGEHHTVICGSLLMVGSPPHVRGTPLPPAQYEVKIRITPACAGNTDITVIANLEVKGSPPHVRGTLAVNQNLTTILRITPACAGNTEIN